MHKTSFLHVLAQAEEILNAQHFVASPLERYLALRDMASYSLVEEQPGLAGRVKTLLRRVTLAPLDRYHEALLRVMRQSLLAAQRNESPPAGSRPHLLYLAPFDVLSRNGGAVRILGLSRAFASIFNVTIISVVGPKRSLEIIPVSSGVTIFAVPQTHAYIRAVDQETRLYGGAAFSLGFEQHLDTMPVLRYYFEQHMAKASVCIMNQPYLVRLWREWTGKKPALVYDAPEVNSFFTLRNAGEHADREAVRALQNRLETEAFQLADRVGMCSAVDIEDVLKEQGEALREKVVLVANGVAVDDVPFMPPSRARALCAACGWTGPLAVFMGSAGTKPNLDAVHFIAKELAPQYSHVGFVLIGMNERDTGLEHVPENLFPCGRVSDSAKTAILAMADFALSPIADYDIGSSLKISEYIAHGKPVLATPYGLRGYEMMQDTIHPRPIGELAGVLRESLAMLDSDPTALDEAASRARDQLRQHYDWRVISRRYELEQWVTS
jgi:glycosyltransferase involved in cell wall biosynthesis